MIPKNWFQSKWGFDDSVMVDDLYKRVYDLEKEVERLKTEKIKSDKVLFKLVENIRELDSNLENINPDSLEDNV